MRAFLNNITWVLFAVFAVPTVLVLGSWNSLPGDALYNVKLGMEQALLIVVSPSYQTKSDLAIKYTERRFSENQRLLADKGSVQGLQYLDKQVVATKDVIVQGNDAKEQAQLAQKYIDTLNDLSTELAAQQQAIETQQIAVAPSSGNVTNVPVGGPPAAQTFQTSQPSPALATPTPTSVHVAPTVYALPGATTQPNAPTVTVQAPTLSPQAPPASTPQAPAGTTVAQVVAVQQINESQETIKETIKELEKVAKKENQEQKQQNEQPPGQQPPEQQQPPGNSGGHTGGRNQ